MKDPVRSVLVAVAPILLLSACTASAQHQTFNVDPSASRVAWTLGGNGHHVDGTFHVQSGSIDFDRTAHAISGSVIVAAGSGNSGEPSRDKKMNKDVLDVAHYSEITFVPQKFDGTIAPTGDSTIQVSGIFTLHGTPHELTVPMQIHNEGASLTAKTKFVVPYVKWGLKDPSVFILKVAKEVEIDLTLAGKVNPAN
jgi:polyisoprenoid-binding protein YceI